MSMDYYSNEYLSEEKMILASSDWLAFVRIYKRS